MQMAELSPRFAYFRHGMEDLTDEVIVYKMARGWFWFLVITAPLLIALFIWLPLMHWIPGHQEQMTVDDLYIWLPVSLSMIVLMVLGLLEAFRAKLIINRHQFVYHSIFKVRSLQFDDVRGYRQDEKHIHIVPSDKHIKSIKISTYFGKTDELLDFLSEHFNNLDDVQVMAEINSILADDRFGGDEDERAGNLYKARLQARWLNRAAIVSAAWVFLYPHPYRPVLALAILPPLLGIALAAASKGLIRLEERADSAHPSVFWAFLSGIFVLIRALIDFNLLTHTGVWTMALAGAAVFMVYLFFFSSEFSARSRKNLVTAGALSAIFLAYLYGTAVVLNAAFDHSPPREYKALVTGKHITDGKATLYYLHLDSIPGMGREAELQVKKAVYERMETEQSVVLHIRKGLLGDAWVELYEAEAP